MSTGPEARAANTGPIKGWDILIGLVYVAFATLILLCISIDSLEQARGEAARRLWGDFLTIWLMLVPIPLVLFVGSRVLWRAVTTAPPFFRQLTRATILAFFFAPSFVGAGGPTGAFFLPGPAFLMLIFGQSQFKFWLGLLPILIAWPIALLVYPAWERRRSRSLPTAPRSPPAPG
jgi:hypothetical protein